MVAVSNAFWRPLLEATPFHRRLFLLPHCLSDRAVCAGSYDSVGLHCAGCGGCEIQALKSQAEQLGYSVIVAEGTSSLFLKVLEDDVDAIFGVACLDSLEKSFPYLVDLGVAHMAAPLLKDGCRNTEAEIDQIRELLTAEAAPALAALRSYVPLLRETTRMFQPPLFAELLAPYLESAPLTDHPMEGSPSVEGIGLDWLGEGGKRLRPFVTIASYAVARHGLSVLDCGQDIHQRIPSPVWRLALAIEALHKASLVHDDIEDDDEFRYGRPTLHRQHGVAQAVNVGDYLIGLGYRLIAGEMASLGTACSSDILNRLSHAHLELCRGQGAELQLAARPPQSVQAAEVMKVYAQKTAPAFEVAIYSGLRAADRAGPRRAAPLCHLSGRRFSNQERPGRLARGRSQQAEPRPGRAGRPTDHAAGVRRRQPARNRVGRAGPEQWTTGAAGSGGAISRALLPLRRFRPHRAVVPEIAGPRLDAAAQFPTADVQELMRFLVRMVLRESPEPQAPL